MAMQSAASVVRNDLDFGGKTVLVVGGSSGIGNGVARGFLSRGAEVHVWGTRASAADYDPAEGSNLDGLRYAQVDIGDFGQIEQYQPPFAQLDVLILSQGTVVYKRGEFQMEGFQKVIDINLNSLMACAIKFQKMLEASKGALITISSTSAFRATYGNPAYSASKAGCVALTRCLSEAWAHKGIRVNGVAPGLVDTKLTKVTTQHPERLAETVKSIPLGRIGTTEDMAGVCLFLASRLSAFVVGQTIVADGGAINGL